MADNASQFVNEAQEANRYFFAALQGLAGTQAQVVQRLGEVQRGIFNQAVEAANDQLRIMGRTRDPREFATAQADLVKSYGRKYVESVTEAVDIVADAWQDYGDRLEKTMSAAADRTQRATSSRKSS
jgi:phasin family protein